MYFDDEVVLNHQSVGFGGVGQFEGEHSHHGGLGDFAVEGSAGLSECFPDVFYGLLVDCHIRK